MKYNKGLAKKAGTDAKKRQQPDAVGLAIERDLAKDAKLQAAMERELDKILGKR